MLLYSFTAYPQNNTIDSLKKALQTLKEDSNKVNTLNSLSREIKNTGDYDKAKQYGTDALSLSQKIKFKKGEATSYNNIGIIYEEQGNYPEALKNHYTALKITEEITDKKGIAASYNGIGNIYNDQGNYSEALKNYFASLNIRKEIEDKKGIAASYNNIGLIYEDQGNYPEALKNHFAALKLKEEIGDKQAIAASYNNIGLIYKHQGNSPEALKNLLASLKIEEEIGHKSGIVDSYNNIGNIYITLGNYSEALKNHFAALKISGEIGYKNGIAESFNNIGVINEKQYNYSEALKNYFACLKIYKEIGYKHGTAGSYAGIGNIYEKQDNYLEALKNYFAALKIEEESGDKLGIADCYINLGSINTKLNKYPGAKKYLDDALSLSKQIGSKEEIKDSYSDLATLDSTTGNWKNAYLHHKLFILYRDSLVNEENTKKTVQIQMQYEFDKKETVAKTTQDKKDAIAQKELQKQKLVRNGFVGGFAVVMLFAGVFFRQRNKISKEKKISEAEKERSEELLLNILPAEVATELKQTGQCQPKTFSMVTVMFADFKDFTNISEKVSAELLVSEINYCFSAFDNILQKHKIEKIKTVGDAYMCASGLPTLNYTHAFDVVTAALEIKNFILTRKKEKEGKGEISFEMRIGIHTGPVVAGIVGIKKFSYDIWGDTVNLAARMEQSCDAGNVNISGITYELVKDKFNCTHRGKIQAKNKGEIDMYFVENIS